MRAHILVIALTMILASVSAGWGQAQRAGAAAAPPDALPPFETRAAHALLVDHETGTVLFEKASDDRFAPASLAKLMTMALVFDALKTGRLSFEDSFTVSENAWRKGGAPAGGTTMFARLGSSIKVRDLIRGAVVQIANDSCLVLAEGMAGSEDALVTAMNTKAATLGLTGSRFANVTGLPDPRQYVTARDIARLARHLLEDFPDYYSIYREPAFAWNGINQNNKNPLIQMGIGADGLVAGGSADTGFNLAGSAVREGRRLILVLAGLESDRERQEEARKLIDWGFVSFEKVRLFGPTDIVAEASVFGGDRAAVRLASTTDLYALMPRTGREAVTARLVYDGPVSAPVAKGQRVGDLELSMGEQVMRRVPLYAAEDVPAGGLSQRAADGLREVLFGWWR
jgi:D-alanyl-D-alanine carboxypeptidase (penicillin-binding protein 5/6)